MTVTLSDEQDLAISTIVGRVIDGKKYLTLTGGAGTGKTTATKVLIDRLEELGYTVVLIAPTGKAAARMSEVTGRPARTIHSLLFGRVTTGDQGQPIFSEERNLVDGGGYAIICDESSMVGASLFAAIKRNLPRGSVFVAVGDPFQLHPVGDKMGISFDDPDGFLDTVHRQALDNPIVRIATDLRKHGKPLPKVSIGDAYLRRSWNHQEIAEWLAQTSREYPDVVALTRTNKTRQGLNRLVRRELGFQGEGVVLPGERIICKHNNPNLEIMNGELRTVKKVRSLTVRDAYRSQPAFVPDSILDEEILAVWFKGGGGGLVHPGTFDCEPLDLQMWLQRSGLEPERFILMMHGYAATTHKMQGSEASRGVLFIDRAADWVNRRDSEGSRRWIYTGLTRFRDQIVVSVCL